jgi:hypothetical protein
VYVQMKMVNKLDDAMSSVPTIGLAYLSINLPITRGSDCTEGNSCIVADHRVFYNKRTQNTPRVLYKAREQEFVWVRKESNSEANAI